MLSLFRTGPKMIVLGTRNPDLLKNQLLNSFEATESDIVTALNYSCENSTIIFITKPNQKIAHFKDIISTIYINIHYEDFLTSIINQNLYTNIDDIRSAPGMLIMRIQGDKEKIINSVAYEYQAEILPLLDSLNKGEANQTIILFTDKPLSNPISLNSFEPSTLLVNKNINKLSSKLRNQALRFLNEGLIGENWYEVNIRIYDRYSKYDLHYKRLAIVLDNMDIGLILGEMWTKDYPRFMMSVLVYQIRLFTLISPFKIKEILLGLEYAYDGTRIVDFDLICKNKKIDWTEVKIKGLERKDIGMKYREEILQNIDIDSKEKLIKLENIILNTRD